MSAVVDYDVESANIAAELMPERAVGLIANEDARLGVLVLPACRLDVHAVDLAALAEVVAPHPQASAAVDADLEDVDVLPDESRQVPTYASK